MDRGGGIKIVEREYINDKRVQKEGVKNKSLTYLFLDRKLDFDPF